MRRKTSALASGQRKGTSLAQVPYTADERIDMASRYSRSGDESRGTRGRRVSRASYGSRSTRSHHARGASRDAAERYSRASAYSRDRYGSASRQADPRSVRHARPGESQVGSASQYSRTDSHYSSKRHKKMSRGRKIAIGVACFLLVAVIGAGTAFALYVNGVNNEFRGGLTDDQFADIQDVLSPTTFDEPFYMLLIGSDERLEDASAGARSDTNIVARIDAPNNTVTLISIPRDTQIDLDGYGEVKFNAAYSYGGLEGVIKEANQLLGVNISHFATVNFEELVQLVDAIGGVDVEVPERIDDPDAGDVVIEAGQQHLDGEAALVFARSRAYVDGDFTRTSNQRLLIESIVDKVLSMPATDLPGIIQAGAQCVTTDLTVNDLFGLVTQFQSVGDITMYSCMVPSETEEVRDDYGNLIESYVVCDTEGLERVMEVVEEGGDPSTVQTTGVTGSALDSETSTDTETATGNSGSNYNPSNEYGSYNASGYGYGTDYGYDSGYGYGY